MSKRGRRMWLATRENGRLLSFSTTKANNDYLDPHPVLVLPLDDIEGLTERVAQCLHSDPRGLEGRMETSRAVLSALGAKGGK